MAQYPLIVPEAKPESYQLIPFAKNKQALLPVYGESE